MLKVFKILSVLIVLIGVIYCSNNVYAASVDMNLENNATQSNTSNTSQEPLTRITINTQELRISNVLSICLIAVGIVLILLAIAILIKLKV